ncbi:cyclic nucleotide-binding domain-containing protein [bacterium]|jgi:CRP-like cAMP-binding protein|nr:cyclic nucleotide-binding domain-containing protein [bacterium]
MQKHPHFFWEDLFKIGRGETGVIEVLKQNVLFKTLTRRELRYLSHFVYERTYQPDEAIFKQGDRGLGMYVIARGLITISTESPHGDNLVTTLGAGSFFGEVALVDQENLRTATAVATERTVLVGFFKPDLTEILQRKPAMGVKILYQLSSVLARRLLETTEKITLITRARKMAQIHEDAS